MYPVLSPRVGSQTVPRDNVTAQIAKSGASPSNCSSARLSTPIRTLYQQQNGVVEAYKRLVDQYTGVVARPVNPAVEHQPVRTGTKRRIEAFKLSWVEPATCSS